MPGESSEVASQIPLFEEAATAIKQDGSFSKDLTAQELSNIYILDRQNGRVVVIDKEGKYKAQYIHDKIKGALDLAVSEKNKKIIILTGDKLLSLEVKHF